MNTMVNERLREYAQWGDPVSLVIPDPDQARRVQAVVSRRKAGKNLLPSKAAGDGAG